MHKLTALETVLEKLISCEYEEDWFEFKENWFEPHALGEYISGMSNAAAMAGQDYAYFIWGIENSSHTIVGTSFDFHRNVKNEPLEHYLARQLKPDLCFQFQEITFHGKRVVALIIPAAKDVPVSFDRNRYYRVGSSKVNLLDYPKREAQLFMALRGDIPTIENTAADNQDLNFQKLFAYYGAKGIPLSKKTFKKNLDLLTPDGKYNMLAQLLSDDSQIPIRFASFTGTTKASPMYAVREFGNDCLLYSLEEILRYGELINVPQADERNRIVERKEVPLFNQKAFREAAINACVHNNWLFGAPSFTAFHDRIEILSRGALPPKQTRDGFFAGESVPVNEKLAKIFLQVHISEQTGRGIPAISNVYGKEAFSFRENNIKVTIPYHRLDINENAPGNVPVPNHDAPVNVLVTGQNAPVNVPVTGQNAPVTIDNTSVSTSEQLTDEDKILRFCIEPKSAMEIAACLGCKDKRTVRKRLDPLIERGRLAMTVPEKPNSRLQKYITVK